tara:strand:- start:79 stop:849 length:771 start_codon:yes stop_codon:yes gene_type:complete
MEGANMKPMIFVATIACVSGLVQADLLADSKADFSGVQGVNGWFYGYYNISAGDSPSVPGSFREMEEFSTDFVNQWSQAGADDWAGITETSIHPHLPGAGQSDPNEYWSCRRWVSTVTGTVNLSGLVDEGDLGGDSTDVYLYVDGVQAATWAMSSIENSMIEYDIDVEVSVGSTVDFFVAPRLNIFFDGTIVTASITGDSCCPADLNMDGTLNFFDVSTFLAAYTSHDPLADFTDDGEFNFFDVSAFLNAYNAGCP